MDGGFDVSPPVVDARRSPLLDVVRDLERSLTDHGSVDLIVADPDAGDGAWPGETRADGTIQRSWRDWFDLAEGVQARMRPLPTEASDGPGTCRLRLVRLGDEADFHGDAVSRPDRYAPKGDFGRLRKHELPGFLLPFVEALGFAAPTPPASILVVGCHRGDEIAVLRSALGIRPSHPMPRVVGVDLDADALAEARRRHPDATFLATDVRRLPADLGRFDLIVAIDVLQSRDLDGPAVVRTLVADHASDVGGVIVGLPCSRLRDGEILWGARTRNFAEIDLSLVVRDLAAYRRYFHQHRYRTRIGGRYDLLLAGRRRPRDGTATTS